MVAEIKSKLATYIIFATIVVSLHCSFENICFRDSSYVISYLSPRSATDGYPSFIGHLK